MAEVVPDLSGTVGMHGISCGLLGARLPVLQRERPGRNGNLVPCGLGFLLLWWFCFSIFGPKRL